MEPTDSDLAAACLDGDRRAFEDLVERHRNAVFNLAWRMTGNAAEAEDLAQEAFIRAWRKMEQYKPEFSFRNWVMGICANLTRNRFRSSARRRAAEQGYVEIDGLKSDSTAAAGDEALERALMDLPETTRVPIVLKYMEGLSIEEIARTLNLGLSAVKMRLVRGRDDLLALVRRHRETGT